MATTHDHWSDSLPRRPLPLLRHQVIALVGGLIVTFPILVIGGVSLITDQLPLTAAQTFWGDIAGPAVIAAYAAASVTVALGVRAILVRRVVAFLVGFGITVGLLVVYALAISRYWA